MGFGHLDEYWDRRSSKRTNYFERPNGFPKVVVLCGSTRFIKLFDETSLKLTLNGMIVLSVGTHYTADHGSVWEDKKEMLDELHKRKIDLADQVFVLNKDGYIGSSTRSEIEYAKKIKKPIRYLEPIDETCTCNQEWCGKCNPNFVIGEV